MMSTVFTYHSQVFASDTQTEWQQVVWLFVDVIVPLLDELGTFMYLCLDQPNQYILDCSAHQCFTSVCNKIPYMGVGHALCIL